MKASQLWTVGAVVAVLAVQGGAFGLGVQPRLAAAATADQQTMTTRSQNAAISAQLASLSRVAAKESDLRAADAVLEKRMPSSLKLNTFSRELRNIAALDGVTIESLVPSAGTDYAAPNGGTTAVSATPATPAPTPTASASAAPAPAAAAASAEATKSPYFGATDPSITGQNFTVVPVTVVVTGSATAVLAFARDAEHIDRLFAVTGYSSTADSGQTTATLSGSIYALVG